MIQQTSMEAYNSIIVELGDRQQVVYDTIVEGSGLCNHDIAWILGLEINQITPRVKELCDMGLVCQCGSKYDDNTGRHVMTWKVR